jgi:hypothetical protein
MLRLKELGPGLKRIRPELGASRHTVKALHRGRGAGLRTSRPSAKRRFPGHGAISAGAALEDYCVPLQ